MLVKKYTKARLSPYRKLFFQLGLLLSLSLIYVALEWKTVDRKISDLDQVNFQSEEMIEIPMTQRIIEVKPPPPAPPSPEKIEIVTNDEEIVETVLESTETDQSEIITVTEYEDIEEVIEEEEVEKDIPFAIIEEVPVFPGCRGDNEALKACLQEKINKHVHKYFRSSIAQELGLTPGKKKIYVQFKIDKTGEIIDIRARGPHIRLEKEAIRVISLLPEMTPGKQRTKPVRVSYTLPVTLQVLPQ